MRDALQYPSLYEQFILTIYKEILFGICFIVQRCVRSITLNLGPNISLTSKQTDFSNSFFVVGGDCSCSIQTSNRVKCVLSLYKSYSN